MRAILCAGAVLPALATPAMAQLPQSVVDACWTSATPAEARIGYCTRVIASGELEANDMAGAFTARGNAYTALKQYDRAITDFDQAIKLAPNEASHYNNRCFTRAIWGEHLDQALKDCNTAIRLAPTDRRLDSRGLAHLKAGRHAAAEQDYTAAIALKADYAHAFFGRGIARLRQGKTAAGNADLAAARKLDAGLDAKYAGYGIKP
jgi:tetratricopeptide (TPR) repeat protein